MKSSIKNPLFRAFDLLFSPLTFVAALQMRTLRRYGLPNFPLGQRILNAVGVFPILRHFYEPLFHPADLDAPLSKARNLPGINFDLESQMTLLGSFNYNHEIIEYFDGDVPKTLFGHPFPLDNCAFRHGDIDLYYSMVRRFKPRRIIEIGSGFSTLVALQAVEANEAESSEYRCEVTAIEPYPWFRHAKLNLIPQRVESVDLKMFADLGENDILFIDSSHMIRPQGDVLFEILEVLPIVAPGVIVHVHDVFTPRDYLEQWVVAENRFWNEQYLLEAFLSCNDRFRVLLAPHYLQIHRPELLLDHCPLLAKVPQAPIHSFWIQRC